uniref:Protein kinase domain-containing protein n=1 Tax=Leersia perrieri TaxID=77586 RepID=A0A0D9WV89_9ORYZ
MPSPSPVLLYTVVLLIICGNGVAAIAVDFTYNGFTGSNFLLDGSASVGGDGIFLLTNGTAGFQQGSCFYPHLVSMGYYDDMYSFSSTFVFAITCSDTGSSCGAGMTFVISSAPDFQVVSAPASAPDFQDDESICRLHRFDGGGTIHQVLGWSFKSGGGDEEPLNYSLMQLKLVHQANRKGLVTWMPATVSLLAILAACLMLRWWWKKKKAEERQENWEAELGPCRFTYRDLRRATDGFTRLLGKGGFGRVYGGILAASGMPVAVKMISSADSEQGMAQFMAEIIILGRLRHRNLVRLLGYCRHKDQLLLVYEHMSNGSLDKFLHGQTKNPLIWPQRLHIIKCVAAGLLYLHEDWEQVIVHRDVKASNVLLDTEMNGKLGDFGLARLHDHGADAHTTHVAGTRGYLAPELTRFGKATKATDVFAFGAFILEVACGRRPLGLNARRELLVLVEWVRDTWARTGGSAIDAMDPRMMDYVDDEVELVLKLGLLCSHPLPEARPGMRLVKQYLDGDMPLPEFSPDYLYIKDIDHVFIDVSSALVATTITEKRKVQNTTANGSLDKFLHGQTKNTLIWPQRLHIVKCVSGGLYLHEDWEHVIVHQDVKANDVLLDTKMNGKLGGFGLARLHDHDSEPHTMHIAGMRGYLGKQTPRTVAHKATNVFALGALILEVACRRRPVGLNARGELLVLIEWVRDTWVSSGCVVDAVDPRLEEYAHGKAWHHRH